MSDMPEIIWASPRNGGDPHPIWHGGNHFGGTEYIRADLFPQLTQQAENVSKPEITNADEIKTLRDEMAMAALTGVLSLHAHPNARYPDAREEINDVAKLSYRYADAMMEARRQK